MSSAQALLQAASQTPRALVLFGVGLVAVASEIAMLVSAVRRHGHVRRMQHAALAGDWHALAHSGTRQTRVLELCAAVPPAIVLALTAGTVQQSRAAIVQAHRAPENIAERAQALSQAMQYELAAVPIGIAAVFASLVLACLVIGIAASARIAASTLLRGAELEPADRATATALALHAGPSASTLATVALAFIVLGFGPVALASFSTAVARLSLLPHVAMLDASQKLSALAGAAVDARTVLDRAFVASAIGTVVALALSFALLLRSSSQRARRCSLRRTAWVAMLSSSALALTLLAAPMRQENDVPWPPGQLRGLGLAVTTPPLRGDDPLVLGPLLEVAEDHVVLERERLPFDRLRDHLEAVYNRVAVLHPSEGSAPMLLLACAANLPGARLRDVLAAASLAGYRSVTFVFETRADVERPLFGKFEARHVSGARARLSEVSAEAPPDAVLVRAEDAPTCVELASQVVRARHLGKEVELAIGGAGKPH
jgi:hypothetical protein